MADAFSWTCPDCGRRVPAKVTTCRCGYVASEGDRVAAPGGTAPAASDRRLVTPSVLAVLLLILAAGAGTLWLSARGRLPYTAPATVPAVTTNAVARTAANEFVQPTPARLTPGNTAPDSPAAGTPEGPSPSASPSASPSPSPSATRASLEDVISGATPAVVRVETTSAFGTGFFVRPDTILTNVHVVTGNVSVTVRRADGTTQHARVDTTAPELDIAVLRVDNAIDGQPTIPLGSGIRARAGQEVIALGSPLGLQNTVTRGIVSAVRQTGAVTLVQTDAAINPGNSGGPLLDRGGAAIGITTMGMRSAQGLSFAVAIDHAVDLLDGRRPQNATGTPMTGLSSVVRDSRSGPSESETTRTQATAGYEQAMVQIARRADAIDDRWRSFRSSCYEGRIVGTFDHEWFALWDARAMQGAVSPGCGVAFNDLRRAAEDVRQRVAALNEAARQAGVFPGTVRDILRRYHLDYVGWTQ